MMTQEQYQLRKRAASAVKRAIRTGELVRGPCEACGTIHAHHRWGYEEPLRVVWLCQRHHELEHAQMRHQRPIQAPEAFLEAYRAYEAALQAFNEEWFPKLMGGVQ